jgi:hypothetical protein
MAKTSGGYSKPPTETARLTARETRTYRGEGGGRAASVAEGELDVALSIRHAEVLLVVRRHGVLPVVIDEVVAAAGTRRDRDSIMMWRTQRQKKPQEGRETEMSWLVWRT